MPWSSISLLFVTMLMLAMVPSVSVLTVSARSAAYGFSHGVMVTLGIVLGDVIYILVAVYGLSLLADWMGEHFVYIRYLGAIYLVWLGVMLWHSNSDDRVESARRDASLGASFHAGLLITLADQKAILFYLGFFPAFFELSRFTPLDTGIIITIAALAIGLSKLVYAWLADRAGRLVAGGRIARVLNRLAAGIMVTAAVVLVIRA